MIKFDDRYLGSAQLDQVTWGVLFKGYLRTEHFKAYREKGRLHLISEGIFDIIVPTVKYNFIVFFVGGSKERDALNVIVMKMR